MNSSYSNIHHLQWACRKNMKVEIKYLKGMDIIGSLIVQ